jgi:hypothetical protein
VFGGMRAAGFTASVFLSLSHASPGPERAVWSPTGRRKHTSFLFAEQAINDLFGGFADDAAGSAVALGHR